MLPAAPLRFDPLYAADDDEFCCLVVLVVMYIHESARA